MLRKFCAVKKALVFCAVRHRSELTEVYDYRKPPEGKPQEGQSVNCVVIHPIFYPNHGPSLELYYAEEAIGLVKAMYWNVEKGPFWVEKVGYKTKEMLVETEGPKENGLKEEQGGEFHGDSAHHVSEDPDLYDEWKNTLLRSSLAKSSLMRIRNPNSSNFFGKGQIERLRDYLREINASALFINTELTTLQIRNISDTLNQIAIGQSEDQSDLHKVEEREESTEHKIRVFDRFTIILQIFAKRANSPIAKLQIELAYLQFLKSKLTRDGTTYSGIYNIFEGDLTRYFVLSLPDGINDITGPSAREIKFEVVSAGQRGAVDKLRGEGEIQVEIERRIISEKENKIRRELMTQIAYTNAGKSALMNQLTAANLENDDRLFQTLTTITKKIHVAAYQRGVVSDTIGFITNLPHELIESFKATLEEVQDADIVLHVRDISHPHTEEQRKTVLSVLKEMEFEESFYTKRIIEVWNKVDLLTEPLKFEDIKNSDFPIVPISALHGMNMKKLLEEISKKSQEILGLKKYRLYHSPDTHQTQMRWLAEQANVWNMIDPHFEYETSPKFPLGYIAFYAYLDDVTYRRYQLTFRRKGEDEERREKPHSDWIKGSMPYHERKRIREMHEQKRLEEKNGKKEITTDKDTK